MPTKDLHRTAKEIIDKCEGYHDPKEYALFRANKLQDEGDMEGAALWKDIAKTIDEIFQASGKGKPH